ncbi:cell division protein FtsN [Providencia vermicola]|uniref:Cell division protein FtsN n=2 Tax=Providencia TaxID=586 RepID=A0AAI9MWU6_PROST|nr:MULTISPECIES: cell division protein FtsN [Providencia]ELR5044085.1 cell division protein FtsN [Providencia rettgeri]MTB38404.1 cell division protein FtsN [Providencia sp. wls1949]MTC07105.1 cell division protein FtsN [Providencia sp. wls1948]ELR5036401.1 cell division protein FtsN [Providencia stuartii]ELR5122665.1 cell division protein FtsN [Providencia stuartii]
MAQKDYVARGRSPARRKTSKGKSKKAQGLPITTLVVAVGIVVLFVGGLFYITQNKKESPQNVGANPPSAPTNTLPPKPEERWRYIKELERRGVDTPNIQQPNSQNGNIMRPSDLTPEQRQLLEQIDSDRRGPVTNLQEVPYNGQPVPRSQVIINEPTQPVSPPVRHKPTTPPETKTETRSTQPAQSSPAQSESKPANNLQNMLVQCGSFRTAEQAESVRATLAFSGIESRITVGGGWHRIVLGPYSKATAEKMRDRASSVGVSGCILRASGG